MFRIPSFYEDKPTFKDAWKVMSFCGDNDALAGMQFMNRKWEAHCADPEADDDEFFENWSYEANAYNVVFEDMGKLFGEAA